MFETLTNDRIKRAPVAIVFEDYSDKSGDHWWHNKRTATLEEGLAALARQAVAPGTWDPRYFRLYSVKWDDGSETPAFLRWSLGKTTSLYLNSASGSHLLIARFARDAFLASPLAQKAA